MIRCFISSCALAAVLASFASSAMAATTIDIRGDWAEQSHYGGTSSYVMHWTTEDAASGAVSGTGGQPGNDQWSMSGTINGNHLVFTETYYGGGYSSTEDVTVSADGNSYSGTFQDSNNTTGTITATRTSGPPSGPPPGTQPPGDLRATATQVICTYRSLTDDDLCTATVGDAGPQPLTTPTGDVKFSAARGVFTVGDTCTLQPTSNSPGVSSCAVVYQRPYEIPPARSLPKVSAAYSGDSTHAASSGNTEVLSLAGGGSCGGRGTSNGRLAVVTDSAAQGGRLFSAREKTFINIAAGSCGATGGVLGVAAAAEGATGVGLIPAAATGVAAAGLGALSGLYSFLTNVVDPYDRHWRSTVKPKTPKLPHFARGAHPKPLARAFDAMLTDEARTISLLNAFRTSIYRAQSAAQKNSKSWTRRQMIAAAGFMTSARRSLSRHPKLVASVVRALRSSGQDRKLTADGLGRAQDAIRAHGIPRSLAKILRRTYGASAVADVTQRALRVDPASVDRKLSEVLSAGSSGDKTMSKLLAAAAKRLRANPLDVPGIGG